MRVWWRIIQRLLLALYRQRILVLVLLLVGVSGGTYLLWSARSQLVTEASAAGTFPIEVSVQNLRAQGTGATLTLKEKNGSRSITMTVGGTEALAIAREQGYTIPADQQPRAYDLMTQVIQQMGGRVDRVLVNDANQQTYFAEIILSDAGATKVVKARPADAVALALKAGAPIFVEDKVLEKYGAPSASP